MPDKFITIGSPGLCTTVQDGGRFGYQRYGMPVSGAMDVYSMQLANWLVGNHSDAACLEATLTGPDIHFGDTCLVAVCGAGMAPAVNGKDIAAYQTIMVKAGDLLSFKTLDYGCRMYIAFSGGVDAELIMGSRSTCQPCKLGGWKGRSLQRGDMIPLGSVSNNGPEMKKVPDVLVPDYRQPCMLRILPGPEVGRLSFEGLRNLMTTAFMVDTNSDRMGYRLTGLPVGLDATGHEIISSGIVFGTIQVPANGQPIIMMADRQTTGGYARIAVVSMIDHTLLAQLRPGDDVSFSEIKTDEACKLLQHRNRMVDMLP
jgi:antagonist of KipI